MVGVREQKKQQTRKAIVNAAVFLNLAGIAAGLVNESARLARGGAMRRRALTGGCWVLWATLASAQGWHEPKRGTAERKALMDALRGPAQSPFGARVAIVLGELRVSGNHAFAMVRAPRPGRVPLQTETTPGWARYETM